MVQRYTQKHKNIYIYYMYERDKEGDRNVEGNPL